MARTPKRPLGFTDAALDELLQGARSPEELDEVFRTLKRAMTERILRAELTDHLGYPEGGTPRSASRHPITGWSPCSTLPCCSGTGCQAPDDHHGSYTDYRTLPRALALWQP